MKSRMHGLIQKPTSRAGPGWPWVAAWLWLTLSAAAAAIVVPGTANPWLAGMPAGSTAHDGDVAPAQSPVEVMTVPIVPGSVLMFSASGQVRKGPSLPSFGPDGDSSPWEIDFKVFGSENGLADLIAPKNALLGVFLGDAQPDQSSTPASLSFITSANRNFATLAPQVKQVFFIGDGLRSDGTPQRIVVPSGASRLFLGTMDGVGWYNNEGAFTVEVRLDPPVITIEDGTVTEGNFGTTVASFDVRLSIPSGRPVTADYTTADGTAVADADYVPVVITVIPPPNLPPRVTITEPIHQAKLATRTGIRLSAEAFDSDGTIAQVEFLANSTVLGVSGVRPYGVVWNNAPAGSYVITARATDDQGAMATNSVTVTVIPISADVAIVCDADAPEVSRLEEYLLEIGLTSYAFAPTDLTLETLQPFKLILWDDLGGRVPSLTETTVRALSAASTNGVPIYFIGENLTSAAAQLAEPFRSLWTELIHLTPVNGSLPAGPMAWLDSGFGHPILNGRFGMIEEFAYAGVLPGAVATGAETEVLGRAGGTDVLVAYPDQNQPDTGGPRSVTQSFLSVAQGDDVSKTERKELFLNAVCWLIRCPRCSAINLRTEMTGSADVARLGTPFTYEISVFHSGECEATGVVVIDSLPGNARFIRAETEQGTWRMEDGVVTFNLGRVLNGSRTVLSVTVLPVSGGELRNLARVRGNGPEVATDDNASEMATGMEGGAPTLLGIELSSVGVPRLRLTGGAGGRFRLQTSTNLMIWTDLTNRVSDGWTMGLPEGLGAAVRERFFRAVSP